MATVSEVVTRAARLAGVAGVGSALSAEDMDWGIDTLNDMLFAWALDGMDLGHSEVVSSDTLLVDDAYLRGIRYSLAVEMAAEKGTEIAATVPVIAMDEQGKIRAALCDIDEMRVDSALLRPPLSFDHTSGE
jgi:hypothetical protein